ncbi:MAG: DUF4276 family protein [Deltaproteobacteria bacterium]|nr:DUF4276 family protein [Deltaproteobacteria bacterium]
MSCVGLIVEGTYDEAALTEFVRKCVPAEVDVICRPCGSAIQLMKKFPGFLESFRHVNAGLPVDNAIVVRDADHKRPNDLIAHMENRISGRSYPFPRHLLVIVQELEAWVLADEQALSSVTGKPLRRVPNPETLDDPKARLENILSDAGIVYTAETARRIASAARADLLSFRCPSFKRFQQAVTGG